ncbi:hypothetical protein BSKO_13008 [Bryopsis sp. KO-2023]|nr:hypothetical protein BSKO_13008 [Bryopsis sp. KO-2023]
MDPGSTGEYAEGGDGGAARSGGPIQGGENAGDGPEGGASPVTDIVASLFRDELDAALQNELLPRAQEIEEGVSAMQYEADCMTNKAQEERKELEAELSRLTDLVLMFQRQISQLLPGIQL